jgi:hypothetical protein
LAAATVGALVGAAQPAAANADGATTDIVGGTTVNWQSTAPFFVQVFANGHEVCGGSLITPTWVLTAAHCTAGHAASDMQVLFSNANLATPDYLAQHPLFDGDTGDGHDLALLEVPKTATAGITPIQVGTPWSDAPYAATQLATVVGTGQTGISTPADGQVRAAGVTMRADSDMEDIYGGAWIDDLMIGAGSRTTTICLGDSGGPLVVQFQGHPVQVGVVSFITDDCANAAAYAELSHQQLAWLAIWGLGDLSAAWNPCTQANGSPGVTTAYWGTQGGVSTGGYSGTDGDGHYYAFACVAPPPPPSPPTPPAPGPKPPPPCPLGMRTVQPQLRRCDP